jgi:hypothetical protein
MSRATSRTAGGVTSAARDLAHAVGQLESVFVAAQTFCELPTAENHTELSRRVASAMAARRGRIAGDT